jgi:hypothetical protein
MSNPSRDLAEFERRLIKARVGTRRRVVGRRT